MSRIVVDTSAMVSIMAAEASAPWLEEQLTVASGRMMSAPTAVELGIVLEAKAIPGTPGVFGPGGDHAADLTPSRTDDSPSLAPSW